MKQKIKETIKILGILVIANVLGNLISNIISRNLGVNTLEELENLDDDYNNFGNDFTEGE